MGTSNNSGGNNNSGSVLRGYNHETQDKPSEQQERQQRLHLLDIVVKSLLATGIEERSTVAVKGYPDHPLHFSFHGVVENEDPDDRASQGTYGAGWCVNLYTKVEVERQKWPDSRTNNSLPYLVSVWVARGVEDTTRDYQLAALEAAPELYNKLRAKGQRLSEAKSGVTEMVARILKDLQQQQR